MMADVQGTHHSQVLLMWYEYYFLSFSSSSSSIFIPSSRDSYSHIKEVKKTAHYQGARCSFEEEIQTQYFDCY